MSWCVGLNLFLGQHLLVLKEFPHKIKSIYLVCKLYVTGASVSSRVC